MGPNFCSGQFTPIPPLPPPPLTYFPVRLQPRAIRFTQPGALRWLSELDTLANVPRRLKRPRDKARPTSFSGRALWGIPRLPARVICRRYTVGCRCSALAKVGSDRG